jgi:hypothetical protein
MTMDLVFTQSGMLMCSTCFILLIVALAVKSPLFYVIGRLIAMWLLMFAGAGLGLFATIVLHRPIALIVGIMISAPTIAICWQPMLHTLKDLRSRPAPWS